MAEGAVTALSPQAPRFGGMTHLLLHRRRWLGHGLALGLAPFLPGRARACEFFSTTLRIEHPWTRATREGDRFAAVNMKFNEVTVDDRLVGAHTPVAARAGMGGVAAATLIDFAIPAGRLSALSEEHTYLRLEGLRHALEVGRTYPLTLVFEKGGEVLAAFDVDYA